MRRPYYQHNGEKHPIQMINFRPDGSVGSINLLRPQDAGKKRAKRSKTIINMEPITNNAAQKVFDAIAPCDPELEQNIIWEDN